MTATPTPAPLATPKPLVTPPAAPRVEPAGAARFTAVSYPNLPVKTAAAVSPPDTVEDRLTALENMVHSFLGQNDPHATSVKTWLSKIGARIKADVKKVI
jgi:hypothetical protein